MLQTLTDETAAATAELLAANFKYHNCAGSTCTSLLPCGKRSHCNTSNVSAGQDVRTARGQMNIVVEHLCRENSEDMICVYHPVARTVSATCVGASVSKWGYSGIRTEQAEHGLDHEPSGRHPAQLFRPLLHVNILAVQVCTFSDVCPASQVHHNYTCRRAHATSLKSNL